MDISNIQALCDCLIEVFFLISETNIVFIVVVTDILHPSSYLRQFNFLRLGLELGLGLVFCFQNKVVWKAGQQAYV